MSRFAPTGAGGMPSAIGGIGQQIVGDRAAEAAMHATAIGRYIRDKYRGSDNEPAQC